VKLRIAFVTKPGSDEIDVERIGAIEDHPDDDANLLIRQNIAVEATEQEIAEYEALLEHRAAIARLEEAAEAEPVAAVRRAAPTRTAEPAAATPPADNPA
jgi:hypothetical protein